MSIHCFEIWIPKLIHEEYARRLEILHCEIKILFGRPLQPTLLEIPADTGIRIVFEALSNRCVEVPAQPDVVHVLVPGHEHTGTQLHDTDFDWWKVCTWEDWMPIGNPQYRPQRERTGSSCSTAATQTPL